jgi:hypothetical protein
MLIKSEVTGLEYESDNSISIYNPKQYGKFITHGAIILDVLIDKKTENCCIVFDRKDVAPLFEKWVKHEL